MSVIFLFCILYDKTLLIHQSDLDCWTVTRWTYAASKGAINILTKDMALDLAPFKIRNSSSLIYSTEDVLHFIIQSQLRLPWLDLVSGSCEGYHNSNTNHPLPLTLELITIF